MGAKEGNQNAKKEATRVPACLSISDEKGKNRRTWVVQQLQKKGIEQPTTQQISRYVKDWCYARIDEAIQQRELNNKLEAIQFLVGEQEE